MRQSSNPICMNCVNTYHAINGLMCTALHKLVEYDEEPACDWENFDTNNI